MDCFVDAFEELRSSRRPWVPTAQTLDAWAMTLRDTLDASSADTWKHGSPAFGRCARDEKRGAAPVTQDQSRAAAECSVGYFRTTTLCIPMAACGIPVTSSETKQSST